MHRLGKCLRSRLLLLWPMTLLLAFLLSGQIELPFGRYFVRYPAEQLRNPLHLASMDGNQAFVASVGGVAFDQIAKPASAIRSLKLAYDGEKQDGMRVSAIVEGRNYALPLYDWQLVPIAKFANSDYYSCFTLFGKLLDRAKEQEILKAKGRVLNYHPAFDNTLMGLRLFQLDVLLVERWSTDLPKAEGEYILGAGETQPDLRSNRAGMNAVMELLRSTEAKLGYRYRSYVICDYGRPVSLTLDDGKIALTGEPYYYCWRYQSEEAGFNRDAIEAEAAAKVPTDREALVARILKIAREYDGKYNLFRSGTFVELLALPTDVRRAEMLRRYNTESLTEMAVRVPVMMAERRPVHLKEFGEILSERSDLLRAANPEVWNAGVVTMRNAAFFRYVRKSFPATWAAFLKSVSAVPATPRVETPTVMQ